MSVGIFTPTLDINKWQMSLCNNSSDNKSYWIHRVDVKVSAQVTTVTYMHQSQPWLHSPCKHLTVHLELWPGNHLIWCNATCTSRQNEVQVSSSAIACTQCWLMSTTRLAFKLVFCRSPITDNDSCELSCLMFKTHRVVWLAFFIVSNTPIEF